MTNKIPKPAYQFLLGFLILTFTVVACNNKGEKKETVTDTTVVKPMDETPGDTARKMGDTVIKKPVKDPI